MNYCIINPSIDDIPKIKSLYLKNRDTLSIPFNRVFDDMVNNSNYWIIKHQDNVIGLCGIVFHKRLKCYEIVHLVIDSDYRHNGLAIVLLKHCINNSDILNTNNLFGNKIPLIASAKDGFPNNTFYDRISVKYELCKRKTTSLRRYTLDIDKIMRYG